MFLYSSAAEALAWLEASDKAWGDYAAAVYAAAVKRRDDEERDPAP